MPARFRARPNRFELLAELADGEIVRCHLADPGRLVELLRPGVELRLRPADRRSARKTRYSVALVRSPAAPHPWVSLEPHRANKLAEGLLRRGRVQGVGSGWTIRREFPHGRSRFDFLLTRENDRMLVEVKSVTLVEGGIARFPDAPTARGTRHLRELADHVRRGGRALVLFIVQRSDARSVTPARRIDPSFAEALANASAAGVLIRAHAFHRLPDGGSRGGGPLRVRTGT